MPILALLHDFAGRPQPHLFSNDGWTERHKDETLRLVPGSKVYELEYPDMRSLNELARVFYPDLFPATVCDSSLSHAETAPAASLPLGSLSRLAIVGE